MQMGEDIKLLSMQIKRIHEESETNLCNNRLFCIHVNIIFPFSRIDVVANFGMDSNKQVQDIKCVWPELCL